MTQLGFHSGLYHPHQRCLNRGRLLLVAVIIVLLVCLLGASLPFGMTGSAVFAAESIFYDFIAQASSASWSSGAGSLPFPGSDSDNRGFACYRDNAQLEDNSIEPRVLETHPQWVSNGWIMGRYPQVTVPSDAELKVTVGFFKGATGSDGVTFEVQFEEFRGLTAAPKIYPILSQEATYDGKLDSLVKNLSSVAGKTGSFILYVNAGQSSGQDWAAWAEAVVETAPPQLPDLIIESIECDWDNLRIGYVIKNAGEASAPAVHATILFVDGEAVGKDIVDQELEPGESYQSWFDDYAWEECQTIKVTVCADNPAEVEESNEQNNCLTIDCVCAPTPPPLECPSECECLTKDEGYARGLEFCLDDNGAPIVCEVVDAKEGVYKYCFKTEEVPPVKEVPKPEPTESDVDGDGEVGSDDVAAIAAHYGGSTGTSQLPWDPNSDGIVDFKDLAIVGAHFGKSIVDEKLKDIGIYTPRDLLNAVDSAGKCEDLSIRAGIGMEQLLKAIRKAEIELNIPDLGKHNFNLLDGLNIGSIAALQSVDVEDSELLDMLYDELRLNWIASGGKERGEPLPSRDELLSWITAAREATTGITVSEEGDTKFPDGSTIPPDEGEDAGGRKMPGEVAGIAVPASMLWSSLVFTEDYPGIGAGGLAEGVRPTVPPEIPPEPCPTISGYIYSFPYDIDTLKIRAERLEPRMQFDPITLEMIGIGLVAVEGKLIDVQQRFASLAGGRITFYNSGCLSPGRWMLTPVFYTEQPETPIWHGTWSPDHQEVVVSSGLEPVTDINFAFIPIDTTPPTIAISHSPAQPGGSDPITFDVSIEDEHMIQKVEVYGWGKYSDGRQTEPELIASYFWESGFPAERSYSFELGPYPLGTPSQIYFEVAAWDYPGNPAVKVDYVRVRQIEVPHVGDLLGMLIPVLPQRYHIASIGEIVFSKDSDGTPPEGEMHCASHVTLAKSDGTSQELAQDYPYFNWVEALCDRGVPVCWPWVPVLAVPEPELNFYDGYTLSTTVYEGDSSLERFLRALLDILTGYAFISLVVDTVGCVFELLGVEAAAESCVAMACDLLSTVNIVGRELADPEDDYMGAAAFMTTRQAGFGLEGGATWADYYAEGSADAERTDWFGTLLDGAIVEGACDVLAVTGLIDSPVQQGVSRFVNGGGDSWIRVQNHLQLYQTRPLGEIKVKFVGARVLNDRDGSLRGEGDVYGRTLVGTIGGQPANSNDHSLSGDDLSKLPYSAADIHSFGCGDVSSGSSFTKDRFIFDRSFTDPNLALLYIQIGLWDDDGDCFADNTIGLLSISWPMDSIVDMIEHPDEAAARYGGGRETETLSVTIVHPVETYTGEIVYVEGPPEEEGADYYYIIRDTREVFTRLEYTDNYTGVYGRYGSIITYEVWVNPRVSEEGAPPSEGGSAPGGPPSGGGSGPTPGG